MEFRQSALSTPFYGCVPLRLLRVTIPEASLNFTCVNQKTSVDGTSSGLGPRHWSECQTRLQASLGDPLVGYRDHKILQWKCLEAKQQHFAGQNAQIQPRQCSHLSRRREVQHEESLPKDRSRTNRWVPTVEDCVIFVTVLRHTGDQRTASVLRHPLVRVEVEDSSGISRSQ